MSRVDTAGFFPLCLLEARYGDGWIAVDTAYATMEDKRRIDWLLDSELWNEMHPDGDDRAQFNGSEAPKWLAWGETPEAAIANLYVKNPDPLGNKLARASGDDFK